MRREFTQRGVRLRGFDLCLAPPQFFSAPGSNPDCWGENGCQQKLPWRLLISFGCSMVSWVSMGTATLFSRKLNNSLFVDIVYLVFSCRWLCFLVGCTPRATQPHSAKLSLIQMHRWLLQTKSEIKRQEAWPRPSLSPDASINSLIQSAHQHRWSLRFHWMLLSFTLSDGFSLSRRADGVVQLLQVGTAVLLSSSRPARGVLAWYPWYAFVAATVEHPPCKD